MLHVVSDLIPIYPLCKLGVAYGPEMYFTDKFLCQLINRVRWDLCPQIGWHLSGTGENSKVWEEIPGEKIGFSGDVFVVFTPFEDSAVKDKQIYRLRDDDASYHTQKGSGWVTKATWPD